MCMCGAASGFAVDSFNDFYFFCLRSSRSRPYMARFAITFTGVGGFKYHVLFPAMAAPFVSDQQKDGTLNLEVGGGRQESSMRHRALEYAEDTMDELARKRTDGTQGTDSVSWPTYATARATHHRRTKMKSRVMELLIEDDLS